MPLLPLPDRTWRLAAVLAAACGALFGASAFAPHPASPSSLYSGSVPGFAVASPHYALGSSGTSIAAISFDLFPVTPKTVVYAGVAHHIFADTCRIGPIDGRQAQITCKYDRNDEPHVVAADSLTIVAADSG